MWYRYETHMHSMQGSGCAYSHSADMVRAYHAAGYAGAVLTDHFIYGNTAVPTDLPWEERMDRYYQAYLDAKPTADELGFDLLFGMEHFYRDFKEVLVYGMDLAFWKKNSDIPSLSLSEFADRVHEAGGFLSHAHPFRFKSYMTHYVEPEPDKCDAIEVYNSSDNEETNAKAEILAKEGGFLRTSGGDSHRDTYEGIGKAGMAFPYRIRTSKELVKALRSGDGRLIIDGVIRE